MNNIGDLLSSSLKDLEENFNAYSEDLLMVRMDDFKRAVIGEVNQALSEHGGELLRAAPQNMEGFAFCVSREMCREQVESKVGDALRIFQTEGAEAAIAKLEEIRSSLEEVSNNCSSRECSDYLLKVLTEVESAFSMASRIQSRMDRLSTPLTNIDASNSCYTLEALAALSNPHRVNLMNFMKGGVRAFSEMTEHSGLKAGHLQFHLRNLIELGLLDKTDRRGSYTITAEGIAALQALQDFGNRLNTVRGGL